MTDEVTPLGSARIQTPDALAVAICDLNHAPVAMAISG